MKEVEIVKRKVHRVHFSCLITMPKEWVKEHGIEPHDELTIVVGDDLRILNPKNARKHHEKVGRLVGE